jgi:hypothetical protein
MKSLFSALDKSVLDKGAHRQDAFAQGLIGLWDAGMAAHAGEWHHWRMNPPEFGRRLQRLRNP